MSDRPLRLLAALLLGGLSLAPVVVADEPTRPNVLIFLIDDLGRSDIGIDGSPFHDTPNLDALARSAVRFTDFYAAHPVCSPTRAALMTGKAPQRLGITDWIHPGSGIALAASETTLGEAFRARGYRTGYVGKWHLGESDADHPTTHGFEWTRGVNRAGQPASYHFPYRRPGEKATVYDVPDLDDGTAGDYLTDALTTGAIEFLERRDPDRPFLLCFGHYAVHTPIQPPAGLPAKYRDRRAERHGDSPTPTLPAPFGAVSRARQDDPAYAAMVENLDRNVGRVLDALDRLGLRDDTIVVFTSDNGGLCTLGGGKPGPTCNLPWRGGKGWTYEGGIRIPTWIAWPGHLQPAVTSVPGSTADLFPTLLDLCAIPPGPLRFDGRSLAGVLRGRPDEALQGRMLAWYYPHDHGSGHRPSAAIRRGSWKLIHRLDAATSELYDLKADPGEARDLAAEHPERAAALRAELLAWIVETTTR